MNETQKKAFVVLIFSYVIFIISMVLNLYWSSDPTLSEGMPTSKDLILRALYLLFSILAISSFVRIAKENNRIKASVKNLFFPSFLIILPVLILLSQLISIIQVISN